MHTSIILNQSGRMSQTILHGQYLLMAYPQAVRSSGIVVAPPVELASFQAKEVMEGTIIRWMHRIISSRQRFVLEFSHFTDPSNGKLQVYIQDKRAFQQLAGQLEVVSQYIRSYDCPEINFNLQLRTNMLQADYSFSGSFEVNEFLLLKKDFDTYKPMNVFALRP